MQRIDDRSRSNRRDTTHCSPHQPKAQTPRGQASARPGGHGGRSFDRHDMNQAAELRLLEAVRSGKYDPRKGTPGQFKSGARWRVARELARRDALASNISAKRLLPLPDAVDPVEQVVRAERVERLRLAIASLPARDAGVVLELLRRFESRASDQPPLSRQERRALMRVLGTLRVLLADLE